MELFSKETRLEIVKIIEKCAETLVKLKMERKGKLDLISKEELKEELGVSGETLRNWEKLGLKRYQSPTGRSRKIYYLLSDVRFSPSGS